MNYFLAFAYNVHDSSVSLADEERVLLVLEAERFFGEKKKRCSHAEMEGLVAEVLRQAGIGIESITAVACTAYKNDHLPEALRNVRFVEETHIELLGRSFEVPVLNHHLAHAAMVYAFPRATDVVIDVCDGGGDFGAAHFTYRMREGSLHQLSNKPIHDVMNSRFYSVVSRYLYRGILGEGKLMALASMGNPRPDMVRFLELHLEAFCSQEEAESVPTLAAAYPVEHYHRSQVAFDLAASTQVLFERLRVESVAALPPEAPQVLLAGGATLNIVANSRVRDALGSRELLLPPCCDDTGQSLGALLFLCRERCGVQLAVDMPFLGYSDALDDSALCAEDVSDELVDFLAGGGIAFMHRGLSEIGPRALGHRSILAKPSNLNYDLINHEIKHREYYRPVAPLVPREDVAEWFQFDGDSPYMLHAASVTDRCRLEAPGVCHYDGSARMQTVAQADDPFLHRLLSLLGQSTGCPLLINTSLNGKGVPIHSRMSETRKFAHEHRALGVRAFGAGGFQSL